MHLEHILPDISFTRFYATHVHISNEVISQDTVMWLTKQQPDSQQKKKNNLNMQTSGTILATGITTWG
jgi:hypothetical protein